MDSLTGRRQEPVGERQILWSSYLDNMKIYYHQVSPGTRHNRQFHTIWWSTRWVVDRVTFSGWDWASQHQLMRGIPTSGIIKKPNPRNQSNLEDRMVHHNQRFRLSWRRNHGRYQILGKVAFESSMEETRWWITFKETNQQYMEIFDTVEMVF